MIQLLSVKVKLSCNEYFLWSESANTLELSGIKAVELFLLKLLA